jgi:hypothetical protein
VRTGRDEAGYTTAAFAALAFVMALIAAGAVLLARQDLRAAASDLRQDQERLELEGIATAAAARLLAEPGSPTLRWTEPSSAGPVVVFVEAEALKIAPAELVRPANLRLVQAVAGPESAEEVAHGTPLLAPGPDGVLHREQVAALSSAVRWRECAASISSIYSRLTALALPTPRLPSGKSDNLRPGELWRVSVNAADGAWIDRVVRMTGKPAEPIAVVEDAFGRAPGNRRGSCLDAALDARERAS